MSETRESKTVEISDNSLTTRFKAALRYQPDWAQSFTATMIGSGRVRLTYSDNGRFGVDLQEAWNYVERQ